MGATSTDGLGLFFGLVNLAFGAWLVLSARRFRTRGIRVPGVVTGLERSDDPQRPTSRPIFRFTTLDGRELVVASRFGEVDPPQPGDHVTVLYLPHKPQRARIDTGGQRGSAVGWIVMGFGVLLTVLFVLNALSVI